MLDTLELTSRAVFALAGFGAGVRLAQMARREGGLPTHTWGSALIFVGGLGLVGYGLGPLLVGSSVDLAIAVLAVSDALERAALIALGGFLWKVFGPSSGLRRLGFMGVAFVLGLDWIQVLRLQQWPDTSLPLPLAALTHVAFAVPLCWSTFESGLQHLRSRRQLAIGLTDPVVTHRFLLWTLGSGGLAAICLLAAVGEILPPGSGWADPLAVLRSLLHLATAAMVVLGLFPPPAYERWLTRRS